VRRQRNGSKEKALLVGYTGIWPREVLEVRELFDEVREKLGRPGVYVLYRDQIPYYVGQAAGHLYKRLRYHALVSRGRRHYFWNFFSAFEVPKEHLAEVEAMLIAALPTANSAKPKIAPIQLSIPARHCLSGLRLRRAGLTIEQIPRTVAAEEDVGEDEGETDTAE